MKISDFRNEEAIELLVDIIDPATRIIHDEEVRKILAGGKRENAMRAVKIACKKHAPEMVEILARLNNQTPEEYNANIVQMIKDAMEIFYDPDFQVFFESLE